MLKLSNSFLVALVVTCLVFATLVNAQSPPDQKTAKADAEAEKKKALEAKALILVDSLTNSIQNLKLPENKIRTSATLGALLWAKDPDRARNLFRQSVNSLVALIGDINTDDPQSTEMSQSLI